MNKHSLGPWNIYFNAQDDLVIRKMFPDGQVDAICNLICALCEEMKISAHGISPKHKGRKLDAETFNKLTGWDKKSNQHERDAAMCVFSHGGIKRLA